MMRKRLIAPAALVASLAAPSPARAIQPTLPSPRSTSEVPPGPGAGPPPGVEIKPPQVWYGWQSLIIHGVSASLLAVAPAGEGSGAAFTIPTAITGMVFAGPIVHWAHGH